MKLMIVSVVVALIAVSESASFEKRDLTSDLLSQGQALMAQATALQAQLTGAGKTSEASSLMSQMQVLQTAITALSSLDPNNVLSLPARMVAEQVLQSEESKIMAQLKALSALAGTF